MILFECSNWNYALQRLGIKNIKINYSYKKNHHLLQPLHKNICFGGTVVFFTKSHIAYD